MDFEELKQFSNELKKAREEADISLQQISSKTRIDLKFLQAIEEGNFEILPEVYIRAFVKEYAVLVNLDGQETLKKYELAKKGKLKEKEKTTFNDKNEEESPEKPENYNFGAEELKRKNENDAGKAKNKNVLFTGAAIAAVVLLALVYFFFIQDSSPEIIRETPFNEVLEDKNDRFEVQQETPLTETAAVGDSLSLRLFATDTCWVSVVKDGVNEQEFMLYPNLSKTISALNSFDLILGNGNAIELFLNGNKLEFNANIGRRTDLRVNRDGITNIARE